MTPQFTTPCYVRVDDKDKRKEICEKLDQIGYHNFKAINNSSGDTIFTDLFFADASYTNEPSYVVWKNHMVVSQLRNTHIDCGTNAELFLALAGMRSDRHKNQWYIFLPTGCLYQYTQTAGYPVPDAQGLRRATAQEIIEHFNRQTNETNTNHQNASPIHCGIYSNRCGNHLCITATLRSFLPRLASVYQHNCAVDLD